MKLRYDDDLGEDGFKIKHLNYNNEFFNFSTYSASNLLSLDEWYCISFIIFSLKVVKILLDLCNNLLVGLKLSSEEKQLKF